MSVTARPSASSPASDAIGCKQCSVSGDPDRTIGRLASRRTSLLGCLLRGRGVLFGNAGAAKGVRKWIVPLVASEFIDRAIHLGHENLGAPGFVPGRGIVHRELIQNGFLAGTRETLHHVQSLARTPERTTWSEVGDVHHQRVALPVAPRVSS